MNVASCGYQFRVQGPGPTIGGAPESETKRPQAPRLAILPISNSTYEPNFEIKLANYLRREFSSGAGAEIVGPSGGAELFLSGSIMQISLPTLSFDQTTTFESRVEMLVSVRIEEAKTKKARLVSDCKRDVGVFPDARSAIQPRVAKPGVGAGGSFHRGRFGITIPVVSGYRRIRQGAQAPNQGGCAHRPPMPSPTLGDKIDSEPLRHECQQS